MNRKKGIETTNNGKKLNKQGQTSKMKEEIGQIEESEDVTKYGEFISSYFAWLTLDKQKQKAEEMENITKEKKNGHWGR